MIDQRWTKWLNASINTYFDAFTVTGQVLAGVKQFFPGQELAFDGLNEWIEIRTANTRWRQPSQNEVLVNFDLNVMITVKKSDDGYRIHTLTGIVESLFKTIALKSYGEVSEILISCLNLDGDLDTTDWGEMTIGSTPVRVLNKSVEGLYRGTLTWPSLI